MDFLRFASGIRSASKGRLAPKIRQHCGAFQSFRLCRRRLPGAAVHAEHIAVQVGAQSENFVAEARGPENLSFEGLPRHPYPVHLECRDYKPHCSGDVANWDWTTGEGI